MIYKDLVEGGKGKAQKQQQDKKYFVETRRRRADHEQAEGHGWTGKSTGEKEGGESMPQSKADPGIGEDQRRACQRGVFSETGGGEGERHPSPKDINHQ